MNPRRILFLILLFSLALRLGWALSRPSDAQALGQLPDQLEYLQAGQACLDGNRFSFYDPRFDQVIFASRTPGYPLFVAACRANVTLIRVAQAVLDTSTVLAIYLLARRWLSPGRSLIACAIVAINPLEVYFVGLVLSETLYIAMLAWSAYLISRRHWVFLGLATAALTVMVRPSGIALPIVMGFAASWVQFGSGSRLAWAFGYMLTAIVFTVATLTPWAVRNDHIFGELVWLTTQGGITLYDGFHPAATGGSDQSFLQKHPQAMAAKELERDEYFRTLAMREIQTKPRRVAQLAVEKARRTWSPVPQSEQFSGNRLYRLVGLFYAVPLFAATLAGLFVSRLRIPVRLFLLTPAVILTIVHCLSVGSMRYRLPAEPFMAVLAASIGYVAKDQRETPPSDI